MSQTSQTHVPASMAEIAALLSEASSIAYSLRGEAVELPLDDLGCQRVALVKLHEMARVIIAVCERVIPVLSDSDDPVVAYVLTELKMLLAHAREVGADDRHSSFRLLGLLNLHPNTEPEILARLARRLNLPQAPKGVIGSLPG